MKLYIMTYGHETPRAFATAWECAAAVEKTLEEEDAHVPDFRAILDEVTSPEDGYGLWVVDWRGDLVIRTYCVGVEG